MKSRFWKKVIMRKITCQKFEYKSKNLNILQKSITDISNKLLDHAELCI